MRGGDRPPKKSRFRFRDAELSHFYGFSVFGLPGPDRLALDMARPAIEARDRLRAGCRDAEVYDLVLAVTGSEEQASEAYASRIAARLKRGERPEV